MRRLFTGIAAAVAIIGAAPAFAEGDASIEARLARVEQQVAEASGPSSRAIQSAVDAYLATAKADASLVGGCGSAGYDGGFWIRGGSFLLKINLTIQSRYEAWNWDKEVVEAHPGVTKTALVEEGLRALLAKRAAARLGAMGGTARAARRTKRSAWDRG